MTVTFSSGPRQSGHADRTGGGAEQCRERAEQRECDRCRSSAGSLDNQVHGYQSDGQQRACGDHCDPGHGHNPGADWKRDPHGYGQRHHADDAERHTLQRHGDAHSDESGCRERTSSPSPTRATECIANSSSTQSVKVGAGAVTISQPTMAQVQKNNPAYPLVLGNSSGAAEPYDGSAQQFISISYYTVKVIADEWTASHWPAGLRQHGHEAHRNELRNSSPSRAHRRRRAQRFLVQSDGTAQFDPSCLTIDTSNNSIPNIMTSYTVTPVYSPTGTGGNSLVHKPELHGVHRNGAELHGAAQSAGGDHVESAVADRHEGIERYGDGDRWPRCWAMASRVRTRC